MRLSPKKFKAAGGHFKSTGLSVQERRQRVEGAFKQAEKSFGAYETNISRLTRAKRINSEQGHIRQLESELRLLREKPNLTIEDFVKEEEIAAKLALFRKLLAKDKADFAAAQAKYRPKQ